MTHSIFSRRRFLQRSGLGLGVGAASGWLEVLARAAAPTRPRACIVLYMAGGPSHIDTFDPKPDAPENIRGDFKPIATAVPGIQISEHFPKLAQRMKQVAIIRGMTTSEGEHGRAQYHTHTGYQRGAGGLVHPGLGAIVAAELGRRDFPLPNYVGIHGGSTPGAPDPIPGPGYLGPRYQPLIVRDPTRGVENLKQLGSASDFENRYSLLEELQEGFLKTHPTPTVQGQATTVERTAQLMRASQAKAFDLTQEPASVRDAYGRTRFGDGCLMARRLVEVGVPFVEVQQTGWDTHGFGGNAQNGGAFRVIRDLSLPNDTALSALIDDLKSRGLLETTLLVWMGEFGRTPIVGRQGLGGRDHYPKAWSTLLVGGGIKGGQVIGKTDKTAATVAERPVSIHSFLATICKLLGIDPEKEYKAPGGRPMRIVDKHPSPIEEVFA